MLSITRNNSSGSIRRWCKGWTTRSEKGATMPRGAHSPRKTQSLYISGVGSGVGGGVRTASPDLVLSSAASASEIPPTSAPPTPRERQGHGGGMGVGVGRPHSLAGDSSTTHAAAYLYSCNPPYARYYTHVASQHSTARTHSPTGICFYLFFFREREREREREKKSCMVMFSK